MPQHQITVISFAEKTDAHEAVENWWSVGPNMSLDQSISPWLLYWAQWFDPWLSSYEYYHGLKYHGIDCSRIDDERTRIKTSEKNLGILKKVQRRKWQYDEQKWIFFHLHEAIHAYSTLRIKRNVVLFNRCTAGVLGDSELKAALKAYG